MAAGIQTKSVDQTRNNPGTVTGGKGTDIQDAFLLLLFGEQRVTESIQMTLDEFIAAGNRILVGVLRALQEHKVSVPDDLSLIACDQTDLARLYPGPITLIDRDVPEIGRTAAQLLLERLMGTEERPARRITFPTRLILGRSCTAPRG